MTSPAEADPAPPPGSADGRADSPHRRPGWFVWIFIGIQLLVPLTLAVVRVIWGGCRWGGWQMYAC